MPIRWRVRRAVSGIASQIGLSASRTMMLLTSSTGIVPKAEKIWFSNEASQESLWRLLAQPPFMAMWQARAASANVGTATFAREVS